MRIPLFDIDATLIKPGNKAHADAYDYALHTVYNQPTASKKEINATGKVDTQILIEVLALHGVSEEEAKAKMTEALKAMEEYYMAHAAEGETIPLPGVVELLKELQQKGVLCGLLTGNVESIAWDKMERAGLKQYLSFGAFGGAVYKRSDLVPIAKKRAQELLHNQIPLQLLFIVGDSPNDITCAREAGIQVVAVSQGKYSYEELGKLEPDVLLHSLEEKDKFFDFLNKQT